MYAIIRTGGKQSKVREGDILDVERLRGEDEVTFTPLLVVNDDGSVISGKANLADVKVVAKILGGSSGPKIDIFKYKNKTGYRKRQGHRQKYTQIEVTKIELPGKKKAAKKKPAAATPATESATGEEAAADTAADEKPAAKKPAAKKPAAKKPAAKPKAAAEADTTDEGDKEA